MKEHLLFTLLIAFAGSMINCKASEPEEPRRDDGLINTFVINNAQLTPELAEQFNFIMAGDLSMTSQPDSYYSAFIMPGTGVLIATDRAVIKPLFPEAKSFELNGKIVSEEEFYAVPGQLLTRVSYDDGVLKAETRKNVKDDNPYQKDVREETQAWLKGNLGTPMPGEITLNDPETYFENPSTIVTLDYVVTTPAKVQQADVKGYVLVMLGSNPQIYALTNERDLGYFGFDGSILITDVSAIEGPLTVANIAAYLKRSIEELQLIKTDGKTVKVYLKDN